MSKTENTPPQTNVVGGDEVAGEAEHAKPPCHQAEPLSDEPPLTMSTAAGVSLASPAAPAEQLAAEVLMVDMDAPLTAVDRLRALAGGSRDIAFEPSDADEILEKLEALAAILSAPNLEIGDTPAPAELSMGWIKVPDEPTLEFLKSINANNQVLAYENGRYYNAWFEFEQSEGGWLWTDEADSEPNPSHYRILSEVALSASEVEE